MDFWRRTARTSRLLKVRSEVTQTQTILETKENNMLKCMDA
jgi:hypothetical protein